MAIFATGQTKCYDVEGEETAYNDSNYPGQDAVYDTGAKRSYRENGDGTVTDNVTNPMWANSPSPHPMTWQEALKRCESLTLAGHSDWRVPNTNELQSLVLYDRAYAAPCIDPVFDFPTGPQDWWYRSSFSDIFVPRGAWVVYSGYGNVVVNDEADDVRVRTVRGGA
ncbi:MAG: Lcl C-terminal domain-containing protein [Planctomycetota bacterium]